MRLISKPNKIEIDFSQISAWFVGLRHYLLTQKVHIAKTHRAMKKYVHAKIEVIQTSKTLEMISKPALYEMKDRKTN